MIFSMSWVFISWFLSMVLPRQNNSMRKLHMWMSRNRIPYLFKFFKGCLLWKMAINQYQYSGIALTVQVHYYSSYQINRGNRPTECYFNSLLFNPPVTTNIHLTKNSLTSLYFCSQSKKRRKQKRYWKFGWKFRQNNRQKKYNKNHTWEWNT